MKIILLTPEEEFKLLEANIGKSVKVYGCRKTLYFEKGFLEDVDPYFEIVLQQRSAHFHIAFIGLRGGIRAIFNEQNEMIYNNLRLPKVWGLPTGAALFLANKEREKKWGKGHETLPKDILGEFDQIHYERLSQGKETSNHHLHVFCFQKNRTKE